jgi:hypothetical protein
VRRGRAGLPERDLRARHHAYLYPDTHFDRYLYFDRYLDPDRYLYTDSYPHSDRYSHANLYSAALWGEWGRVRSR